MVICVCNNNKKFFTSNCDLCNSKCISHEGLEDCTDDKILGVSTDVFIILLVLTYVFFLVLIYFIIQTLQRYKGKPKWLSNVLIILVVLVFALGWVPILNILLIITLLLITMRYYVLYGCIRKKN